MLERLAWISFRSERYHDIIQNTCEAKQILEQAMGWTEQQIRQKTQKQDQHALVLEMVKSTASLTIALGENVHNDIGFHHAQGMDSAWRKTHSPDKQ